MCGVNKHISYYRFRNAKCRLCIYLHRYRYGHTRNHFKEHVYKYNINLSVMYFFIDGLVKGEGVKFYWWL